MLFFKGKNNFNKKVLLNFVMVSLIILAALVSGGCSGKADPGAPAGKNSENVKKVTVLLDWVPNTNHTGLYVAKEKGFFKEAGLDVEVVQPSQGGATDLVATGKAQVGFSYQEDVTASRDKGVPVVSVAAVIQHNTSGFASPKGDGILKPQDFEGKRYGGWGSPSEEAVIKTVMKKANADPGKVKMIDMGMSDFFTAIVKDIDFAWIYFGWDGVEAQRRNVPINFILLKDLDQALDYYTPVIIANENIIKEDPELVRSFLAALSRGYNFAEESPGEAGEILLKYAPELNRELVLDSQSWLSPRYRDDALRWGEQKREVWQRHTDWMKENGLLTSDVDINKAFTNEFLPK